MSRIYQRQLALPQARGVAARSGRAIRRIHPRIVVIDWGIGGLDTFARLAVRLPAVDLHYVSDSGFTPWGKVEPDALAARIRALTAPILEPHDTLVIACNAASTVADRLDLGVEVVDVIAPGVALLAREIGRGTRRLGLLGGARTIRAEAHRTALGRLEGAVLTTLVAQPLSAHVEAGRLDGPELLADLAPLLAELADHEAVLLACTHYPALLPVLRREAPALSWLDPVADPELGLVEHLVRAAAGDASGRRGSRTVSTSGDIDAMRAAARAAFGIELPSVIASALPSGYRPALPGARSSATDAFMEGLPNDLERVFDVEAIRASLKASGVGVWFFDPRDDRLSWDEEMCRIAGCDVRDYPTTYEAWREFVHPEDRVRIEAMVSDGLARGEYPDLEHRLVRRDGSVRHILSKGNVVLGPAGTPERINGVVVDLTDRRHLEDKIREDMRLESLGRLAGGIAHDFNNMLTVILGSANLALDVGGATGEVAESLVAIREAAERSATLTAQLLAFARRHASRPRPTDLAVLVARGLPMLRQLVGDQIQIRTTLPAGVHAQVDPAQLQQALMNLAANARDAMPDGGVLEIALRLSARGRGRSVLIEVADDGAGIAPEVLPRVFEPFFSTKGPSGGAGLGLATVYGIVRQHGGHIHIDSTVGSGTRIAIELPAIDVAAPHTNEVPPPRPPARASVSRAVVLLVDDEPRVRAITATLLRRLGHEVVEAHDGVEALAAAAAHRPDLVVTDLVMPRLGGLELIRALRVDCPGLPAVVLTGYGDASVEPVLPDAVWVSKPYHPDQLAERVTTLLSQSASPARRESAQPN